MEIFAMQGIWGKRSISKKNATRARWLLWPTNFTLAQGECNCHFTLGAIMGNFQEIIGGLRSGALHQKLFAFG